MNKNLILCFAALAIGAAACHKPMEAATVKVTTSDTTYNLVNNSSRILHVDMYTSLTDRNNQTNVRYSCEVPAKGVFKIPFSRIDTSTSISYYYDVYTPDALFSNWGTYTQSYILFNSGHSFNLAQLYLNQARYYFLYGTNETASWLAVDKRETWSNTSVWSGLQSYERYMAAELHRNFTGKLIRKSISNVLTAENIQSMGSDSTAEGLSRLTVYTTLSNNYTLYNSTVIPSLSTDYRKSRDTMVLSEGSYYWVMVRQ